MADTEPPPFRPRGHPFPGAKRPGPRFAAELVVMIVRLMAL